VVVQEVVEQLEEVIGMIGKKLFIFIIIFITFASNIVIAAELGTPENDKITDDNEQLLLPLGRKDSLTALFTYISIFFIPAQSLEPVVE